MSPQRKTKSKARPASAGRGEKSRQDKKGAVPLVIAGLLIGAIAVAMGYSIHKQSETASRNAVPQAAPESGQPPVADPGQAPGKSESHPSGQGGNQGNQVLTN